SSSSELSTLSLHDALPILGLFLRKTLLPKPSFIEYFICALLFGVIVHLFFARNPLLYFIIFFLLNTVLLTLILKISVKNLAGRRSEEHTSELQSRENLVCR